jgi:hypothetical protein
MSVNDDDDYCVRYYGWYITSNSLTVQAFFPSIETNIIQHHISELELGPVFGLTS